MQQNQRRAIATRIVAQRCPPSTGTLSSIPKCCHSQPRSGTAVKAELDRAEPLGQHKGVVDRGLARRNRPCLRCGGQGRGRAWPTENITRILSASRPQVGLVCSSGDELLPTVDVVRRAGERCDRLAICASIGLAGRGMSAISLRSAFKCRVIDPREAPDQPDWG